jgi:hypothetical protein
MPKHNASGLVRKRQAKDKVSKKCLTKQKNEHAKRTTQKRQGVETEVCITRFSVHPITFHTVAPKNLFFKVFRVLSGKKPDTKPLEIKQAQESFGDIA